MHPQLPAFGTKPLLPCAAPCTPHNPRCCMQLNPDEASLAAAADKPADDTTTQAADTGDDEKADRRQGRNDNANTNDNANEQVQEEPKPKVRHQQIHSHAMCCLECAGPLLVLLVLGWVRRLSVTLFRVKAIQHCA